MPYRVDVSQPPHDILERLLDLGALDVASTEDGVAAILPDAVSGQALTTALGDARVRISEAQGRDADSVWFLTHRGFRIGRVTISPVGPDAPRDAVLLEDSEAFGTGHHPTTRLCLAALDEQLQVEIPPAVLDVGVGSGVLAMAALRLGVPRVVGVDIDPVALAAAVSNARLNRLEDRLDVVLGGPDAVNGQWPLVLANVLAAPLMEMAPVLSRRIGHHGRVMLSGIPQGMADEVATVYRNRGLHLVGQTAADGWAALVLQASW